MSKFFNIGIGVDNDALNAGMDEAAKIVAEKSQGMASAAVAGGTAIEKSHTKATASVKTIRQELRQAQKDAEILAQKYGDTSAEAIAQSRAVAELKDRYDDFREKIDAFHPDGPFKALGGALQGAAGAFAAVQGTMALFGVESEATQQAMLKVQAAMAISQGVNAIMAAKGAFAALGVVINTTVIPSLMTTKGLLISTGFGAIIAAVATLAYYWYETSQAEEAANKRAEEYAENLRKIEEERKKTIAVATETWQIEANAMKDGTAKELEQLKIRKANAVNKQVEMLRDKEITQEDFNKRAIAIDQDFENQRTAILEKAEQERQKRIQSIKRAPIVQAQRIDIQGGGQIPIPDYRPALIAQEQFLNQAREKNLQFQEDLKQLNADLAKSLEGGVEGGISAIAASIGTAFATGKNVFESAGMAFLDTAGRIAQQTGALLIAFGISMDAFRKSFANPFTAIAAGAALVAIGAAVSASAKSFSQAPSSMGGGGGGGMGGSGVRPEFDFSRFGQQSTLIQLDGVVRGSNLVLAVNNTNQQKKRIR